MKIEIKCQRLLYWTPRILAILATVFISLFALDSFSENNTTLENILGFLIHLIPTYLLIIVILIAWKWELIGGIIFIILGMSYIIMAWNKFPFLTYLIISGPLFLVGVLFLLNKVLIKFKTQKE